MPVEVSLVPCVILPDTLIYRNCPNRQRVRRAVDLSVAIVALVFSSPILILAAVAIYLEDRGPLFFVQERVGRFGKPFIIYKLRTMKVYDLGDRPAPKDPSDPRITCVGRILRKTSIDELPQLINIVKGNMAIVGPRPEMPFVVATYESWQHLRLLVTPGLTGLWQVQARKTIPLDRPEATMIDIEYIRDSTLLFDFMIVLRTMKAVLGSRGAF